MTPAQRSAAYRARHRQRINALRRERRARKPRKGPGFRASFLCPACLVDRPAAEFFLRLSRGAEGVRKNGPCKRCHRALDAARRRARKEDNLAYERRVRRENPEASRERQRRKSARQTEVAAPCYVRRLLGWKAPEEILGLKRAQLYLKRAAAKAKEGRKQP